VGWGRDAYGSPGRAESAIDEVAGDPPCDFLLLRDRGFDPSRVLVPTAGGPDSDLSAETVTLFEDEFDASVLSSAASTISRTSWMLVACWSLASAISLIPWLASPTDSAMSSSAVSADLMSSPAVESWSRDRFATDTVFVVWDSSESIRRNISSVYWLVSSASFLISPASSPPPESTGFRFPNRQVPRPRLAALSPCGRFRR